MSQQRSPKEQAHVLPIWFEWLRRHIVLSLLIVAEFVVNGGLVVRLVVHDLNDPASWTWYEWVSAVVLAPAIGLAVSGVALALSQTASDSFGSGKWVRGVFTLFGLLGFASVEVWASLVERSATVQPTSADDLLFHWLGVPESVFTPSVIVFAVLLPLAVVFVGFTNKPPTIEDEESWQTKQERKLKEAEYKARMRAVQAGGLGAAFAAAKAAATKADTPPLSERKGEGKASTMGGQSQREAQVSDPLPPGVKKLRPASKGPWLKEDLQAYIRTAYPGVEINEAAALEAIKSAGQGKMKGTAYCATINQAKAWVVRHYGEPKATSQQEKVAL